MSSGSDTLQYLHEKTKNDKELKREELELQKPEIAMSHGHF